MRTRITFIAGFVAGLVVFFGLFLAPWPVHAGGRIPLILYRGGAQGRVVFDHQTHASKGLRCVDCHTDFAHTGKALFTTRKQGLITFEDHQTATKCFACHDGKGTLESVKSTPYDGRGTFNECERCHRNAAGVVSQMMTPSTASAQAQAQQKVAPARNGKGDLTLQQVLDNARERLYLTCRVCPVLPLLKTCS